MSSAVRQAGRWAKRTRLRLMRGISADKRRWNTELSLREFFHGRLRLSAYPRLIQLGSTMACNLRCVFCMRTVELVKARHAQRRHRLDREMPPEVFEQVLALMPYVESFDLTPFGESFLFSQFDRILEEHERQQSENLTMTTAGNLIDADRAERIVRAGVRQVKISIEETEPDRYAQMRVGAKLEQVTEGIRRLNEWKEQLETPFPRLTLAASYMQRNIERLPDMVHFAAEHGVPEVYVQMLELKYHDDPELRAEELTFHVPLLQRMVAEAEEAAKQRGIAFVVTDPIRNLLSYDRPGEERKTDSPRPHRLLTEKCTNPWWWAYIDENGYLWPCCWAKVQFGSLQENSFMEVWNSDVAVDMRRRFLADDIPNYCRGQLCHVDFD